MSLFGGLAKALIGPAISGIGGLLDARRGRRQARRDADNARFEPFGISSHFGTVGQVDGNLQLQRSHEDHQLAGTLRDGVTGALNDPTRNFLAQQGMNRGGMDTLNQYANAQQMLGQDLPPELMQALQRMGGREGFADSTAGGMFGMGANNPLAASAAQQFGVGSSMFGQSGFNPMAGQAGDLFGQSQAFMGMGGQNQLQALQNQLQGLGGQFTDMAGSNPLQGYAQGQMDTGQGFLTGPQDQSFGDVAQQQLDLMRQQAQPFEERQFNQLQNNLFSTGRMGTTGGGLQTEAFARGLGETDLQRQLAANQFGAQLQNQNFGQNQALRGLGANLMGQGAQGFGMGSQIQQGFGGLGQGFFGQGIGAFGTGNQAQQNFGQLGLSAANTGAGVFGTGTQAQNVLGNLGLGASQQGINSFLGGGNLQQGFMGLGQNMLGMGQQFGQAGFQNQFQMADAGTQRALQRLGLAEGLFGFGAGVQNQQMGQAGGFLGMEDSLNDRVLQLGNLSIGAGAQRADAGFNQGRIMASHNGSPFGGFLSGLGGSVGGFFNPQPDS